MTTRSARDQLARTARAFRYGAAAASHPQLRGRRISLGPGCRFAFGPRGELTCGQGVTFAGDLRAVVEGSLVLGDRVFFNHGAHLSVLEDVRIGSDCRFGERLSVHDEDHVFRADGTSSSDYVTAPVVIGDNVWAGANVTVLRGAEVGSNTVIAAGAVVRGTFEGGVLLAGVPARIVRRLAH